ncbi:UDP-glucuronosyl/UDP-glucosyltransferase [Macleaya cordata]|uniref:Glycosyltransferase n=1 Tax=Macleaya cordata TaxID=56857 RepID=A0A200PTW9_MACCD|nr:UDP-glucuronosyl/UDP-glucosyltransferase [Macleaya cordata]
MNTQDQGHIIMFPFMAQGHIIPFLALAKRIAQRSSYIITLVNTPQNIKYLRSTLYNSSSSDSTTTTINNRIRLAELPFSSSDHGLPPNSENTDVLPSHHLATIFYASQTLQTSFHHLILNIIKNEGRVPLCIIFDTFLGWTVDVAKSVGISHFAFATAGGYGTATYFSLWLYLPHRHSTDSDEFHRNSSDSDEPQRNSTDSDEPHRNSTDSDDEFHIPGFPQTSRFHISQLSSILREANGEDRLCKFFRKQISLSLSSDGMLCNTVEEIEPLGVELLGNLMTQKQPVWTIGPLLPPMLLGQNNNAATTKSNGNSPNSSVISQLRAGKELGISPVSCIEWLDHQQPASVLYISFGSQNTISASQMMELALGVEESGKPFIWVLRPPREFDIKSEFKSEWLPEGFEGRINESKRGLLVKKWAPQLEILCHKSTGVFLSHCGWNSVMESLSQGVPILGWPLAAEQAYNSKMMEEEMGVCVELARGVEGKIVCEEVKRVIEEVMSKEGKGEEMKRKAMVIAKKIRVAVREEEGDRKGFSVRALDDFLETLLASKRGKN